MDRVAPEYRSTWGHTIYDRSVCRGSEDGGRRCPSCSSAAGRQAHNDRRRQNRAIRRAVVEWAQQQGFDAAEVALLATSSPSAAKQWAADHQAPSEVFDAPERVQRRKRLPKVPTAAVIGQPEAFGFRPASEIRRSPSKSDLRSEERRVGKEGRARGEA